MRYEYQNCTCSKSLRVIVRLHELWHYLTGNSKDYVKASDPYSQSWRKKSYIRPWLIPWLAILLSISEEYVKRCLSVKFEFLQAIAVYLSLLKLNGQLNVSPSYVNIVKRFPCTITFLIALQVTLKGIPIVLPPIATHQEKYNYASEFSNITEFITPINTNIFPNDDIGINCLINPWISFLKNHFLSEELSKTAAPINREPLNRIYIISLYSSLLTFHWSKYNKSISNFRLYYTSFFMVLII